MADVARHKQVLCVTHLPQIAAMADAHFSVEKGERKGRTFTKVERLDRKGGMSELARLDRRGGGDPCAAAQRPGAAGPGGGVPQRRGGGLSRRPLSCAETPIQAQKGGFSGEKY